MGVNNNWFGIVCGRLDANDLGVVVGRMDLVFARFNRHDENCKFGEGTVLVSLSEGSPASFYIMDNTPHAGVHM